MKNRPILFIFLFALLLLAFFIWQGKGGARFDWDDSMTKNGYRETSAEPYGTQVLHKLLTDIFPGKKLVDIQKGIDEELLLDSAAAKNYVFVGEAMYLDSLDTRRLVDFATAGHRVFIASKTIPYDLMFYLYHTECPDSPWDDYEFRSDSSVYLTLENPPIGQDSGLFFQFVQRNMPRFYRWNFISESICCAESGITPLGRLNHEVVNFLEIPCGKGKVLLHSNPVVFTNYFLLRPEGKTYAAGVFSHLVEGDIFWDAYSRTAEAIGRNRNQNQRGMPRNLPEKHALTYILQQKSLAWAWYLLVGLSLIWLVFRAKRRQRAIPVLKKNENSSLEFIGAIAHLHFREKNFGKLCDQKMRLFLSHLRERYGIAIHFDEKTAMPQTDENILNRLSRVAEVPEIQVRDIFRQYAATIQFEPTEQMMTDFHLAMEEFLKKAK